MKTLLTLFGLALLLLSMDDDHCNCFKKKQFPLNCADTFDLRFDQIRDLKKFPLVDSMARKKWLGIYVDLYRETELRYYAQLTCSSNEKQVLFLGTDGNYACLSWICQDSKGKLIGIDTLAITYSDGQQGLEQFAVYQHGSDQSFQLTEIYGETLIDDNDTMAEVIDSSWYKLTIDRRDQTLVKLKKEPLKQSHWIEKWPTNQPGKKILYSINDLLPGKKILKTVATGDLNNDSWQDHVLLIEDNNSTSLMVASVDRSGFKSLAYLKNIKELPVGTEYDIEDGKLSIKFQMGSKIITEVYEMKSSELVHIKTQTE